MFITMLVISPPITQTIHNKIACLTRSTLDNIELLLLHFQNAEGNQSSIGSHIMVQRFHRLETTQTTAAKKLGKFYFCLRIY